MMVPVLRVARPTDDLEALRAFYVEGLGFEVLSSFEDHDGFSGLILGHPGQPYHLEFTHCAHESAGRAPSRDHLLAFYLPEREAWAAAVERMRTAGFEPVASFNPWWDRSGLTFEDPDGYRVVLWNGGWSG
jgi:catechol 2,3-dioxygenase-like lactoylglutathione lyase family enzyme